MPSKELSITDVAQIEGLAHALAINSYLQGKAEEYPALFGWQLPYLKKEHERLARHLETITGVYGS